MSLLQPAVRAFQTKRRAALGDGIQHYDNEVPSSPGARNFHDFHPHPDDGQGGPHPPTPENTVPLVNFATAPALSTGGTPTSTTVAQVSTSASMIVSVPSSSPSPTSTSALPSSGIMTLETSSPVSQSSAFGSPTIPTTSDPGSLLDGSASEAKKSSGLPGGAIAGIVIAFLLALGAMGFFILRNRRIKKRIARRMTWTTGLVPHANFDSSLEKGVGDVHPAAPDSAAVAGQSPTSEGNGGGEAQAPIRTIARKLPIPYSPVSPTAPRPSYNDPHPTTPSASVHPVTVPTVTSTSSQNAPMRVRVTFVPQLPDELEITPEETLYIQTEFDDGWALCINIHGKQGMVPLECLEGGGGQFGGLPHVEDWHSMRRASSLRSVSTRI